MSRLYLACGGLLIALALTPFDVGASNGTHRDVIRDFLIVKYCGFDAHDVTAGFRIEIMGLIGDGKTSSSAAQIDRAAAAEEVRRDWANRGSGRADPRRMTKGRAAMDHYLAVLYKEE